MSIMRKIIEIDEAACDGCGNCVLDCAENALAIIDGKARVISDRLCDGLGSCLQSCPQDALFIVEREAQPFDVEAVAALQERLDAYLARYEAGEHDEDEEHHGGQYAHSGISPSIGTTISMGTQPEGRVSCQEILSGEGQWPIKLRLVPPTAPFLHDAHIILAADCVPAMLQNFHELRRASESTRVLLACPKFESPRVLAHKLLDIVQSHRLKKLDIFRMEVPCCKVLADVALRVVLEYAQTAKLSPPPLHIHLIDRHGNVL